MIYTLAVAAALFAVLRLLRGLVTSETILDAFHEPLFAKLTPSLAQMFWDATAAVTQWLARKVRLIYTGNGQTCVLYILYYFLALYAAGLGFVDQ